MKHIALLIIPLAVVGCSRPVNQLDVLDAIAVCEPWGGFLAASSWTNALGGSPSLGIHCANAYITVKRYKDSHADTSSTHERNPQSAPQADRPHGSVPPPPLEVLPEIWRRPAVRPQV